MEEGGSGGPERVDWVRKGKTADLTNVPVTKLDEAAKRGIVIDLQRSTEGQRIARVDKVVVEGMPAPKPWWKKLLGLG